jgi:hypothetical protein
MFALLSLSRVAIDRLDPESARKAVSRLIEVQAALAEALVAGGPVKWQVRVRKSGRHARRGGWGRPWGLHVHVVTVELG